MLAIVDYGVGNLASVEKACLKYEQETIVTGDLKTLSMASKIILPGVGSYGEAMNKIRARGIDEVLLEKVSSNTPLLGICLGMQILGIRSEEASNINGLGFLNFEVVRFSNHNDHRVPHVGWNSLTYRRDNKLLVGISEGDDFYFVHSYHVDLTGIDPNMVIATTNYGVDFCSGVSKGSVTGFQFHPEKSQTLGLKIIQNFIQVG